MLAAGLITMAHDLKYWDFVLRKLKIRKEIQMDEEVPQETEMTKIAGVNETVPNLRRIGTPTPSGQPIISPPTAANEEAKPVPQEDVITMLTWKTGLAVLAAFVASFVLIITLRNTLKNPPRGFALFGNMYLAGTIIFGGGPVVIPLLSNYIVTEGWVSSRDFLLGLAIIQAFPGPNFNFAVFLGSLAVQRTSLPSAVGAIVGFIGIFLPGLWLASGCIGLWKELRSRRWVRSLLRGVNALAVGLVFAAVYRLFQIGLVEPENRSGVPLGGDAFWVAVTAVSFVGGRWFAVSPPVAIISGAVLGLLWFAAIKT